MLVDSFAGLTVTLNLLSILSHFLLTRVLPAQMQTSRIVANTSKNTWEAKATVMKLWSCGCTYKCELTPTNHPFDLRPTCSELTSEPPSTDECLAFPSYPLLFLWPSLVLNPPLANVNSNVDLTKQLSLRITLTILAFHLKIQQRRLSTASSCWCQWRGQATRGIVESRQSTTSQLLLATGKWSLTLLIITVCTVVRTLFAI